MALISISVDEFKTRESINGIDIVKNPKTGKLFASCSNGENYKSQGNLDPEKKVEFLYDDDSDDLSDGCFVNPSTENVIASF